MIRTHLAAAALLALAVTVAAVPIAAQGGGKKHHKADSTQTPAADQTLKTGQTVNPTVTLKSDATFASDLMLKSSTTVSSGQTGAAEVFAPSRVPAFNVSPVAFKWELNDNRGWVELVLDQAGNWILMGNYDNKGAPRDLEVVVALKFKSGAVLLFHSATRVMKGRHSWRVDGGNATLAGDYGVIAGGFEMRGAYRLPTAAEAKASVSGGALQVPCKTEATVAAGWGTLWTWATPQRECWQFSNL